MSSVSCSQKKNLELSAKAKASPFFFKKNTKMKKKKKKKKSNLFSFERDAAQVAS
jgi:hypothetical protein